MISERQKNIVSVLENQTNWITLGEIATSIDVSQKTIQLDIMSLNKLLPNDWAIISKRGKGVKIKKPINQSLDVLINIDKDINIFNDLIIRILSDYSCTIESLSQNLYIDIQTMSNLLKRMEKILKDYNLELTRNPLEIHGPELMKRFLLYNLQKEGYGETAIFFNRFKEERTLYNKVYKYLQKVNLLIFPLPFTKLLLFIRISVQRFKEGHPIENIPHPNYIRTLEFHQKIVPIFQMIEEYLDVKLNEDEHLNIFFAFIYSEYYFTEIFTEPDNIIRSIKSEPSTHRELLDFIHFLERKLNDNLIGNDSILLSLYDFHKKIQLRSFNELYEFAGSRPSSLLVKERFSNMYGVVEEIFNEWSALNDVSPLTMDSLGTLTLIIEYHRIEYKGLTQKIAYIYSETIDLKKINLAILRKELIKDIEITPIPLNEWDYILHEEFDIILTDSPLKTSNQKFILINKIVSQTDVLAINKALNN